MVSLINSGANWSEDSAHLECSHAATLEDGDFELHDDTDTVKPKNKKWNFMKKVEDFIDTGDKMQVERLDELRRLILEQMKTTIKKKEEVKKGGGDGGKEEKRGPDSMVEENALSKQRLKPPPKL